MIEKKLIVYCALAIALGVAVIIPLTFLMNPLNAQTQSNESLFNIDVPYAYWTANTSGFIAMPKIGTYGITYEVMLNLTVDSNLFKTSLVDGGIEYYQLQVYSDKGQIRNMTYHFSFNCTGSEEPAIPLNATLWIWFSSDDQSRFEPNFNWISTQSETIIGGGGSAFNNVNGSLPIPEEYLNLENANVLYLDVRQLGYVTYTKNSTTITALNNGVIKHFELTKYGDGFLYNTVLSQNELSKQTNLLNPSFP